MTNASRETASEEVEVPGYQGHMQKLEGGYTVAFETYTDDTDLSPFFEGLPDNQCQSAHWGYVFEGRVGFKTKDGEETFEAGDAYYMPPGHTPVFYAGAKIVEFSPTSDLDHVIEVVTKNIESAGA